MDKATYEWVRQFVNQPAQLRRAYVRDVEAHAQLMAMASDTVVAIPGIEPLREWCQYNMTLTAK